MCITGFVFLWLLGLAIQAGAQSGNVELTGEVRDQAGVIIPQASVTLTRLETEQTFLSAVSSRGIYVFSNLKPGAYRMVVDAVGFKRLVNEDLVLSTGERIGLDVVLMVGSSSETITVRSDIPLLQTESATLGQVIGNRTIVNLPLNGRNYISLVGLSSGVALPSGSFFPRINGGRPRVNEYLYDGISVLQPEPGQVAFFPIIDAIQEFNVESNSPPAEFGRFNGGVINLTTKSGTNEFHGALFEFLRNEVLNARNLFAPASPTDPGKPVFRRNQFGFVTGGPMIRGKTFFFVDYQGTRQLISRVRISTVPTLLQRAGIFSEPVGGKVPQVFDPVTTQPKPGGGFTRTPFPGNAIPTFRVDAVAHELLKRYPLPTSSGTANNFRRVGNEELNQDQFDIRLDHRFSKKDQVFGRFSYARDFTVPVAPLPDGSGNLTSGALAPTDTLGQSVVASFLHVFSSMLTNEVRAGYTRRRVTRLARRLREPPFQSLSLPGIPSNAAFNDELPTFLISGYQQLGPSANTDSDLRTDVTEIADTLTYQRGRHSLKFGLDYRWFRLDIIQPPSPTGQFRFTSLFTDLPGTAGTGFPLASFLLGQVQDFSIDLQEKKLRPRAWFQEYFIQDNWKATRRLTLTGGVRYTLNFPSSEADNQGAIFNLQTQQLQYLGRDGFPRSGRELHKLNFGPRLGFVFQATDKTVVRSGYGLTWFDQAGITTPFTNPQFPFLQTLTQRTLDNINPAFVLSTGPSVQPISTTADAGLGQGVFSVDRGLGSGYLQQWNLAVQRELTSNLVLEIAYAGSKGTHIGLPDSNLNQLTVDQLSLGNSLLQPVPNPFFGQLPSSSLLGGSTIARAQLLKPFPRFTNVSLFRNNVGNTKYHALQVKLEKRFARGLFFLVSYTRSKLIDEASSVFDASILTGPIANFPVADSFNRREEQDVSNGDLPNAFTMSWTYELPIGPGHRLHPSGITGKLADGWQVTGIITLQSGLPLAVSQATNLNAFGGFGTQRPNCVGNPSLLDSRQSTAQFFNVAAFQIAPQFTLGTCSRNPIRGPHYRNTDLALIKRTTISEGVSLDIRMEFFNLTNTPPLGTPGTVLGTAGFGSITSAGDPRVIQFGIKLNF